MTATALRLPDPATDATALRLLRSTARQSSSERTATVVSR